MSSAGRGRYNAMDQLKMGHLDASGHAKFCVLLPRNACQRKAVGEEVGLESVTPEQEYSNG
jgi:hypothetical protein